MNNKVVVVTGGAGVLGSAMAKGLAALGARVAILSRTESKVQACAQELISDGYEAMALPADVLSRESMEGAANELERKWGSIDILVNAAGGNMAGATIMPDQNFWDLEMSDFDQVTQLNLKGTVLPTMIFGRQMAEKKRGSIVNISSMAAQQALTRVMGYSASKAAVDNFTKWMAVEAAIKFGEGIRVNAIAPGFFIADQNRKLLLKEDGSYTSRGQTIVDQTPMKRFGRPDELVSTLEWLCDDRSSFVTGIVVPVDGGFSAFSGV